MIFYKESKSYKEGKGGGGDVARISDFVFFFSKEFKSEKISFFKRIQV